MSDDEIDSEALRERIAKERERKREERRPDAMDLDDVSTYGSPDSVDVAYESISDVPVRTVDEQEDKWTNNVAHQLEVAAQVAKIAIVGFGRRAVSVRTILAIIVVILIAGTHGTGVSQLDQAAFTLLDTVAKIVSDAIS